MSKRSIRLVAGVAGAAMALGTMAPAMADRLGGDVNSNGAGGGPRLPVDVRCLAELPDLFPANVNVNPGDPLKFPLESAGGLLDLGLNDTDNNSAVGGPHAGLFGFGLLGTYGLPSTVGYILGGAIDAGFCLTTPIVTCLTTAIGSLFPVNVNVDPARIGGDPGAIDIGIRDTDVYDSANPYVDGPHLGVLGRPLYGVGDTLSYVGAVSGFLARTGCLPFDVTRVVSCLGDLGDVFPLNVNVNPGDPFRGRTSLLGGLLDVGLHDTNNADDPASGHVGVFGTGLLGTYGIGDTLEHLLGDAGQCIIHGGDDDLLSAVTGMTGMGGSPLSVLGGGSPLSVLGNGGSPLGSVFGLTAGIQGTLTSVLSPGGAGISAELLARVAAII